MPESVSATTRTSPPSVSNCSDPEPTAWPNLHQLGTVDTILLVGVVAMLEFRDDRSGGNFSRLLYGDESTAHLPAAGAIRDQGLGWFLTERSLWTGPLNALWIASLGAHIALVKVANIAVFVRSRSRRAPDFYWQGE